MQTKAWLLVLLVAPAAASELQAMVELLPEAKVPGAAVVLGQVARIHASDLGLMRKLVHLPLGAAPQQGNVAVLQREAAAQRLRRDMGAGSELVAWSGAAEVRVRQVAVQVSGEEIARAALLAARSQWSGSGRSADLNARLLPHDLDVPAGDLRMVVRGADQVGWQRRAVLWVDVWAGASFVRSVPVALEVTTAQTPVPAEAGELVAQPPSPGGASPDREPLAVARGDWAVLRSAQGPITLESRVEVLQDGRPGQKVRVRQQGATGLLVARVTGQGQLELAP